MIDIKLLRENAEMLRQNCIRRGYPIDMDGLIKLDNDCRTLGSEIEALRQERNRLSKECAKDPAAREQVKQIKLQLGEKENKFDSLQERTGCQSKSKNSIRLGREFCSIIWTILFTLWSQEREER